MAEQFPSIHDEHREFIESQKVFFVATADTDGRINLSPKGQDGLRVLGPQRNSMAQSNREWKRNRRAPSPGESNDTDVVRL